MNYNMPVANMSVGDDVEGFYLLKNAYLKSTAAGKPFLSALLCDVSGEIDAKVWDYPGPIDTKDEGSVVKIRGSVSEYRGVLQLTAAQIRLADAHDPVDLKALVPAAPIDVDASMAELEELVLTIADEDYRRICKEMLARHRAHFLAIPAAKSVHHSFLNGLLMHTRNMLRTADFLAGLYADFIDRSLLLAGTLLHDFAKEEEFCFSKLGLVTEYSVKGQLLGHLVMGAQEIAQVADALGVPEDKSVLLQHMLLSHHGEPEFGAAIRPLCAESELLSHIDKIDSRMEIYRETLAQTPAGEFSGRVFALDKRVYNHG